MSQPVTPPQSVTPPDSVTSPVLESPPRPQLRLPVLLETPFKARAGASEEYLSGTLDQARTAIVTDLGRYIPEVSIHFFNEHVLPRPAWLDIEEIRTHLEGRNILNNSKWTVFRESPSQSKLLEPEAFKPFKDVVDQIVTSVIATSQNPSLESLVEFVDAPSAAPFSDRGNLTRPDAYFELVAKKSVGTSEHAWDDIALTCEYKKGKKNEDIGDNARKILWSMHHVMRNDPCRRFALGMTIEDSDTRFWYCNRSDVIVTKNFNFMTDHDILISTIASVCFASDVQLGWDPTITRRWIKGAVCYDIIVHDDGGDKVYRTSEILSDAGAVGFRGQGTRVFRALDTASNLVPGNDVAIKDVWVDVDRKREGDIRKHLSEEALDEEDKELVNKHFLTVLAHGDVKIGEAIDHTQALLMNGQVVPTTEMFEHHKATLMPTHNHLESRSGESAAWDNSYHPRAPPVKNRRYPPKVHYRIVFKEVGVPVHSLESLADVFHALADATIALRLAYKQKKVHRDVSSGNILMYKGVGILGDLEYMKTMATESARDVRTGTLDYMAIEVEAGQYLFTTQITSNYAPPPELVDFSSHQPPDTSQDKSLAEEKVFYHNPLHDLESVWWIGVWTLFCRDIDPKQGIPGPTISELQTLQPHKVALFPGTTGTSSRILIFDKGDFPKIAKDLPSRLLNIGRWFDALRSRLANQYYCAERGLRLDAKTFQFHPEFELYLRRVKSMAGSIQLSVHQLSNHKPPSKRSLEATDDAHSEKRRRDNPS